MELFHLDKQRCQYFNQAKHAWFECAPSSDAVNIGDAEEPLVYRSVGVTEAPGLPGLLLDPPNAADDLTGRGQHDSRRRLVYHPLVSFSACGLLWHLWANMCCQAPFPWPRHYTAWASAVPTSHAFRFIGLLP